MDWVIQALLWAFSGIGIYFVGLILWRKINSVSDGNEVSQEGNTVDGDAIAGSVIETNNQDEISLSLKKNKVKQNRNKVKGDLIAGDKVTKEKKNE